MATHDPSVEVARRAASRLAPETSGQVQADVEAALQMGDGTPPERYALDPVSLGALVVAVAQLGWTIYRDLRGRTPKPPHDVIERHIRMELRVRGAVERNAETAVRNRVIEAVVKELIEIGEEAETTSSWR